MCVLNWPLSRCACASCCNTTRVVYNPVVNHRPIKLSVITRIISNFTPEKWTFCDTKRSPSCYWLIMTNYIVLLNEKRMELPQRVLDKYARRLKQLKWDYTKDKVKCNAIVDLKIFSRKFLFLQHSIFHESVSIKDFFF